MPLIKQRAGLHQKQQQQRGKPTTLNQVKRGADPGYLAKQKEYKTWFCNTFPDKVDESPERGVFVCAPLVHRFLMEIYECQASNITAATLQGYQRALVMYFWNLKERGLQPQEHQHPPAMAGGVVVEFINSVKMREEGREERPDDAIELDRDSQPSISLMEESKQQRFGLLVKQANNVANDVASMHDRLTVLLRPNKTFNESVMAAMDTLGPQANVYRQLWTNLRDGLTGFAERYEGCTEVSAREYKLASESLNTISYTARHMRKLPKMVSSAARSSVAPPASGTVSLPLPTTRSPKIRNSMNSVSLDMDRSIRVDHRLAYKEWHEGIDGKPSVVDMLQQLKRQHIKVAKHDEMWYYRRRKVIDEIDWALARLRHKNAKRERPMSDAKLKEWVFKYLDGLQLRSLHILYSAIRDDNQRRRHFLRSIVNNFVKH